MRIHGNGLQFCCLLLVADYPLEVIVSSLAGRGPQFLDMLDYANVSLAHLHTVGKRPIHEFRIPRSK